MQQMSSAQIVSASAMQHPKMPTHLGMTHTPVSYGGGLWQPGFQSGVPQDVKPFSQGFGLGGTDTKTPGGLPLGGSPAVSAWQQGRAISTRKLSLLEFSATVEVPEEANYRPHKHLFVEIGSALSDPSLESIDVRQIQDKFPEKKGGLKELLERGPQDAFFLVKFWGDLNTNIADEPGASFFVNTT